MYRESGGNMEREKIINDIASLPPEAQRNVIDFIEFLRNRYVRPRRLKVIKGKDADSKTFVGTWKS